MQIADDRVVFIHYTLKNAGGKVIDSSRDQDPLGYIQGHGNIISGLEKALAGKSEGDRLTVTLEPADAYGKRDESLVKAMSREQNFSQVSDLEPGMQFQTRTEEGIRVVTVSSVEGDEVIVDANHPLAGETLTFDVEIAGVREPTQEELSHGHVHGPGGHH